MRLAHGGVSFPPAYCPHGVPLMWRGKRVPLSPAAEEAATMYAGVLERDVSLPAQFSVNFWLDFAPMLHGRWGGRNKRQSVQVVTSLEGCDFSLLRAHVRAIRRAKAPAESMLKPQPKTQLDAPPQAMIDGVAQPLVGARVENPGIFWGRHRDHPLAGRFKRRITAADVTLNLSPDAPRPTVPVPDGGAPGTQWGGVVHDPFVDWVAAWRDPLTGVIKYTYPAPAARAQQGHDREKYEVARRVAQHWARISRAVELQLEAPDERARQLATCVWLLQRLALRVGHPGTTSSVEGNEVLARGVSTLRVGDMIARSRAGTRCLVADFVGKDMVQYRRTITDVPPQVMRNIRECARGKTHRRPPGDLLFHLISAADINAHLDQILPGLSAKVLRTTRASALYECTLEQVYPARPPDSTRARRVSAADVARAQLAIAVAAARVAFLCNHRTKVTMASANELMGEDDHIHQAFDDIVARAAQCVDARACRDLLRDTRALTRSARLSIVTARANYIDPRITADFFNRVGLPIERAWPARLAQRFQWSLHEVDQQRTNGQPYHFARVGTTHALCFSA
jgi:DNA topoisomerase-1